MGKSYTISRKQAEKLGAARKSITDKRVDKRLQAVQLRGEGMNNPAIAEKLDTDAKVVSRWVCAYLNGGVEAPLVKKGLCLHKKIYRLFRCIFLPLSEFLCNSADRSAFPCI